MGNTGFVSSFARVRRERIVGALLAGACCICVAPQLAFAQTAPPEQAAGNGEIVVTAEKRNSTVQSTPISMTALSGSQMQARGITDLQQVVRDVPGISMRTAGAGQTELEMRGLASSGGSSPTVGFYLDEVPLSPPAAALNGKVVIDPNLYDLNRAEVLRGPQGTLYGSGSMGGTIKLITNEPKLDRIEGSYDVNASATQAGSPSAGGDLMVNVPLVKDVLALRLVGTEKYTGGWIDRILGGADFPLETGSGCGNASGVWQGYGCTRGNVDAASVSKVYHDVNWTRLSNVRGTLLYQPDDRLSITINGMYQRTVAGGYSEYDQGAEQLAHYQPYDVNEPFSDTFWLAAGTAKYDAGTVEITSATSFWHRVEQQTMDATELVQNLLALNSYPGPIGFTERDASHQFSQELRFSSKTDSPFQWVAGLFYSQLLSTWADNNTSPVYAVDSVGGAAANPEGIVYRSDNPYRMTQFAAFGEASYKLTATLKATAGLRYYYFKTDVDMWQQGIGTATGNANPTAVSVDTTASGVNPRFNLSYIPDQNLTLYGTVAKGFRPGGVSLPAPPQAGGNQPITYGPDSVWSYEVGEKARTSDGKVSVNADFYLMNWTGVQQLISPPCGYPYTTNAGTARAYGPELEVSVKPVADLVMSLSGTVTSAKLVTVAPGTVGVVAGQPILNIPAATLNGSIAYTHHLGTDLTLTTRLSDNYIGRVYDIAYTQERLPAYNLVDLRFVLAKGVRNLTFFVSNLTNVRAELTVNNTSFAWLTPSLTRVSTNQPRTIGAVWASRF
jgi:outer membrane receptor protein involved in Fe transport